MEDYPTSSGGEPNDYVYKGLGDNETSAFVGIGSHASNNPDQPGDLVDAHTELEQQHGFGEERDALIAKLFEARRTKFIKEEKYIDCHEAIARIKTDYAYHGIKKIKTNISDYAEYTAWVTLQKELTAELIALNAEIAEMETKLAYYNAILPRKTD